MATYFSEVVTKWLRTEASIEERLEVEQCLRELSAVPEELQVLLKDMAFNQNAKLTACKMLISAKGWGLKHAKAYIDNLQPNPTN